MLNVLLFGISMFVTGVLCYLLSSGPVEDKENIDVMTRSLSYIIIACGAIIMLVGSVGLVVKAIIELV